jgi:hypothetical protein
MRSGIGNAAGDPLFVRGTAISGQDFTAGTPTDPNYTQTGPLPAGTDRSGTTSSTAGQATTLAPVNTARRGLNIQNISANPMGINEIGGAASIGSPGTYTLAAGATINVRTNRAVTVVSGTASQPYTATEF